MADIDENNVETTPSVPEVHKKEADPVIQDINQKFVNTRTNFT